MNRRNFLRGVGGILVALPFLETFVPRRVQAQTVPRTKRFVTFFQCNGVNMDLFFPATAAGALTPASFTGRAIEPLAPLASKLLIPRGINMVPYGFHQGMIPTVGCDHKTGIGHKLTAQPLQDTADNYAGGISVDQLIANSTGE